MKQILLILVISLSISCQAQNWKRGLVVAGYHIGTVALGAIGDAQFDEGNKNLAHALHAAEVGALISGPFIFHVQRNEAINYLLSYGFLRFSFFDSFYNMTRDLPILYNGTTSEYDKLMSKMPEYGRAWCKSFSMIVGFAVPIKNF